MNPHRRGGWSLRHHAGRRRQYGDADTRNRENDAYPHIFTSKYDSWGYRLFGDCPCFPVEFPERFESITVTNATLFVCANSTMRVCGLADLKNGGQTAALTPIKNFSPGIGNIIYNARYALVLIDGHFFKRSGSRWKSC